MIDMRYLLLLLLFPLVMATGCNFIPAQPYLLEDTVSHSKIVFPDFPYNQETLEEPYRRYVELKRDSFAFWLSITQSKNAPLEEVKTKAFAELKQQMQNKQFQLHSQVDTIYQNHPAILTHFNRDQENVFHFLVFKDDFVINPSGLIIDPKHQKQIDDFFASLNLNDSI